MENDAAEKWRKTLNKVVRAVVVLRTICTRAFDTEIQGESSDTGFIVDKTRGIILTNRRVVKPGPIVAEARFFNREEIPVYPLYRDPVHDFGFFRFDPAALQFMKCEEIPLAPEAAVVGLDIRVVGNDCDGSLSIMTGTLDRVDREAPHYKNYGYNDFNTFYLQAASRIDGGTRGAPAIDCDGRAVALNSGGKSESCTSYFLPLDKVQRALRIIQNSKDGSAVDIPRGTLQMTLLHKGFDEARRLGLQRETEELTRQTSPSETGILVIASVVPGGPASAHNTPLKAGDLLVRVNDEIVTQFLKLETLLDDNVGKTVDVEVERSGVPLKVTLEVQDLHSITPHYFLEISGGVIHPLSYQQARNFRSECGLPYVAEPGFMLSKAGVPHHAVILGISRQKIASVEDFISIFSKLSRGARTSLEFMTERGVTRTVVMIVDMHEWYSEPELYTRDDVTGLWNKRPAMLRFTSSAIEPDGQGDNTRSAIEPDGQGDNTRSAIEPEVQKDISSEVIHENMSDSESLVSCSAIEPDGQGDISSEAIHENMSDSGSLVSCSAIEPDGQGDISSEVIHENMSHSESFVSCSAIEPDGQGDIPYEDFDKNMSDSESLVSKASFDAEKVIEPTLVTVLVDIPAFSVSHGMKRSYFLATGVVIYQSKTVGIVAVDKFTVPVCVSDVTLNFAAFPMSMDGEVAFLHPIHNYALITYDPAALGTSGASAIRVASLLPEPVLHVGDAVYLVSLNQGLIARSLKCFVTKPMASRNNIDVIKVDTDFGIGSSGVLVNEHGNVRALWGRFSVNEIGGIPIYAVSKVLHKIINGTPEGPPLLINGIKMCKPIVRILEVELAPILLLKARGFGLSDNWITKLAHIRPHVLQVRNCWVGSSAQHTLLPCDMLLAIDGKPITDFRDIENACEQCKDEEENLRITVFRQGSELELSVGTDVSDGFGPKHIVSWCGCVLHEPRDAVRAYGCSPEEGYGVHVSSCFVGNAASRCGISANPWIVEINGKPIPNLQIFKDVIKELKDGEFVRVKAIAWDGGTHVFTWKQDLHYWPTWELIFDPESASWLRKTIKTNFE